MRSACERFGAERAFEIGLADEVCGAGKLDEAAAPIIDALLRVPPQRDGRVEGIDPEDTPASTTRGRS